MTLLQGAGATSAHESRATARWTAGYGPAEEPYLANVTSLSHRAALRRLLRCLELHRDLLATTPSCRAAFATAAAALEATPRQGPFTCTIMIGSVELTFWLLSAQEAERRGTRPKR